MQPATATAPSYTVCANPMGVTCVAMQVYTSPAGLLHALLQSLMVSSLRLRLPCRDLTRDSAACTSVEWSAALATRTAASRSSTWFHTAPVDVIALLGCAGLHFRCIPDAKKCIPGADCASQMQIVHPRSKSCIPGANYASQMQNVHPRCKLCFGSFSFVLQMTQGSIPSA